ncbi:hypothetical protein BC830DRAFT_1260011 [Chytriomyces sp. MP71]|nr:hypothetical protein BC830DRAFT_1260011 [Chytriomyces sp. MP71]
MSDMDWTRAAPTTTEGASTAVVNATVDVSIPFVTVSATVAGTENEARNEVQPNDPVSEEIGASEPVFSEDPVSAPVETEGDETREDGANSPSDSPALALPQTRNAGPSRQVYSAIYSGIPVYEMMYRGIQVMRRISDNHLNATQILKVAGYSKPKRTKTLELEVHQGYHDKIQGGYGKYQGTWVRYEDGVKLARKHKVEHILRPILDFEPEKGDVALTKHNFNQQQKGESSITTVNTKNANAAMVARDSLMSNLSKPGPSSSSSSPTLLPNPAGGSFLTAGSSLRHSRASSEPPTGATSSERPSRAATPSPLNSPLPSRPSRQHNPSASNLTLNRLEDDGGSPPPTSVPVTPAKRPVGRPPRIPRAVNVQAPTQPVKHDFTIKRARRVSYDYSDAPASPPGSGMRAAMDVGTGLYLANGGDQEEELAVTDENRVLAQLVPESSSSGTYNNPRSLRTWTTPDPVPERVPSTFTRDDVQREVLLAIHMGQPAADIVHLLREPAQTRNTEDIDDEKEDEISLQPPINANKILDARQHTPLHIAATYAHVDLIVHLLSHGANAAAVSLARHETPLMRSCSSLHAFHAQNFPALLALLGSATARHLDARRRSLLHRIAAMGGAAGAYYMRCVVEWIDAGAFFAWMGAATSAAPGTDAFRARAKSVVTGWVDARDEVGDTALHVAVRGRALRVAALLVKLGARLDLVNSEGVRVLDLVEEEEDDGFVDERLMEALRVNGRGGRRRRSDAEDEEEDEPANLLDLQIEAVQDEIADIYRAQEKLEQLQEQAGAFTRRIKQEARASRAKAVFAPLHYVRSASPAASVALSTFDPSSYTSAPIIRFDDAPSYESGPGPHSDTEAAGQQTAPLPRSAVGPESSPPFLRALDSTLVGASTALELDAPSLLTPPSTVRATVAAATGIAKTMKRLQDRVDASERMQKRLLEEIDNVVARREDKTKRYKRMMAEACEVRMDVVEAILEQGGP